MGGGRKHKGGSSSSSRSHHSNNKSFHHQKSSPQKHKAVVDDQLSQCMEVQVLPVQQSYFVSLKECTLFLLTIAAIGITCILAGFWAGNAISLQYYEEQNVIPSRRVTSMDGEIHDVLERVLKNVYESEVPPLNFERFDTTMPDKSTTQGIVMSEPAVRPTLCSDGITLGFHDWNTLKDAIHEANRLSAENFLKLNQFMADREDNNSNAQQIDDTSLYYEKDVFFTICPDTTLYARKGPIFVNAENIVLECDGCTIVVGGSHLSFGPHAKNVLVRGVTFRGAQTTSLTFYHDGCDAVFEDCYWYGNTGKEKSGSVADVNSTSSVVFYRCEIDDAHNNKANYSPRGGNGGMSSLTIRG